MSRFLTPKDARDPNVRQQIEDVFAQHTPADYRARQVFSLRQDGFDVVLVPWDDAGDLERGTPPLADQEWWPFGKPKGRNWVVASSFNMEDGKLAWLMVYGNWRTKKEAEAWAGFAYFIQLPPHFVGSRPNLWAAPRT